MKRILVLDGSQRPDGNTETLTNHVLDDIDHAKVYLRQLSIRPIHDQRHAEGGFTRVYDDHDNLIEEIINSDILVFSTPIYWYGMSGTMKNMVDRFSQAMRDERFDLKSKLADKEVYVVSCGGDNPRIKGLPLIQQFQYICDFLGMKMVDYIIGQAVKPGEIEEDHRALSDAKSLNASIKERLK
ncbi:flavodoxin family protein [Alkalihalobacillus sp. CinArs1]|uniref:flavodoxin family protein n=1 Tax=Alkalihalobacillus sp. CinArs1 TaxID=2995314 RepID=UPI0022DDD371|nr:flavodoxin family protein [Alkalihalobacillus sp. CinArs1]